MRSRFMAGLALVAVIGVGLAGCGGSSGGFANTPEGVVNQLVSYMQNKQWDQISSLACAAKKDEVAKQFDFAASLGGSLGSGIDTKAISDSMTIKFSNLSVKEQSNSGSSAVVAIKGTMDMTFDTSKLRDFMAAALAAASQPADQASIDAAMAMLEGVGSQSQPLDETVNVVQENGKWLVCQ